MERLVRFCVARKAGTSFRNRDGVYRNKGMAISGKLALCSMARSINNGTGGGEIQIRTRERVFTPQLFYRRVYVLSRRCSFHARQSRDYARTSAYVRTVSTPSPRQNPFFHGWNMWEGEGADRGIILNYVCPRLVTGRSFRPNRALFLLSSPLSTFAGSPVSGATHSSYSLFTQKRFFDSKRWSPRRMRLVDLRSTSFSFILAHPSI